MALVPIRIDRTSKPPLGVPLRSDGHWSVRGLVRAWAFNEGAGLAFSDSVSGSRLISTTPVAMADGICVSGTQSLGTYDVRNIPATPPFTVIADIDMVENGASSAICGIGGLRWSFKYEQYGKTGRLGFTIGGLADYVSNLSSPKGRSVVSAVVSSDSILFNGLDLISATISLSNQPTIIHVGSNDADADYAKGAVYGLLLYSCALTPTQVTSISENPWQIYEPELVWIEVPDGVGGTAYTSSADAGTVTLTGSATTNYHAYVSSADTGSVTLTGSTTSDYRGLVSHADTGTVTITGNAATDYRGLVSHAGAGSVILAGSTSTDYRNLVSSADTSTVTLTGYAAMDTITGAGSYTSNAEAGSITLSGVTTTNYRTLISGAGTGAVTVTGFTATDTVTAAGAYTSEAAAGTILLTGLSVTSHRSSVADSSAIQIVGSDATGYFGFTSGAEPSAVIITGAETSVLRTWISDAIPGSIVIHGYETSGISPIYEISKIFATARLSGPSATGRITTPTTGIRLT